MSLCLLGHPTARLWADDVAAILMNLAPFDWAQPGVHLTRWGQRAVIGTATIFVGVFVAWWLNLMTKEVEEGPGAPNSERLGPYETKAEAENAFETARLRNEAWSKEDAEWDGNNE